MRRLPVLIATALASFTMAYAQMPPPPEPSPSPVPVAPEPPAPPAPPPAPPTPPVPLPAPGEPPAAPIPPAPSLNGPASIDNLLAALPGVVTHYDSKTEENGNVVLNGLTIAMKKPDGAADDMNKATIGRLELDAFDADAVQSVFDASRYTGAPNETFRTLTSHLVLDDLALTVGGKVVVTLTGLDYQAVQMKQFPFVPGGPNFTAQFKSPNAAPIQFFGGLLDSLKTGPATLKTLHAEISNADIFSMYPPAMRPHGADAAGGVAYDFANLSGAGYDRGKFGKTSYGGGTKSDVPHFGVMEQTIGNVTIDGIDISKVLPWMIKAEWPSITRDPLITFGGQCISDYHVTIPGIGVFDIPSVCVDPIPFVWLIPEHAKMDAKGTFTPVPAGEFKAPAYVAKYFTQPIEAEIMFELAYDPDAGTASIVHYGARLGTFGSVDFSVTAGGLKLDELGALPTAFRQMLSLVRGSLTVVDDGGMAKILDMSASSSTASSGVATTPETLKAQAKGGVDMMIGALGNTPAAAAFGKAFKDFIDHGGKLVVQAGPPAPLHYADMVGIGGKGPTAVMGGFGLSAVQTPQ